MHWHVLGVGAMGGLFARRLQAMGFGVTLLSRHEAQRNTRLTLPFSSDIDNASVEFEVSWVHDHTAIEHLLVCTKAFATVEAVASITNRLTADACVVLLGNGMGYHEHVAQLLTTQTLLAGTTTAACSRTYDSKSDATLWHLASEGETVIGHFQMTAPPAWFDTFGHQPWTCRWSTEVSDLLLAKLVINAVINPPTALYDISNGALLNAPYHAEFNAAIGEVMQVLEACGEAALAQQLSARAHQVATQTASNTSSMRADRQRGCQTEVEAILGYLLEQLPQQRGNGKPMPATPVLSKWLYNLRTLEQAVQ